MFASYKNQSFVLQSKANDSFYMKLRTELKLVNFLVKLKKLIICAIVKCVHIRNFSGPYFLRISPYSVRMLENTVHKNSEYGHFSRNE